MGYDLGGSGHWHFIRPRPRWFLREEAAPMGNDVGWSGEWHYREEASTMLFNDFGGSGEWHFSANEVLFTDSRRVAEIGTSIVHTRYFGSCWGWIVELGPFIAK